MPHVVTPNSNSQPESTPIRESWSDSARRASAAARRGGAKAGGGGSQGTLPLGGVGRNRDGSKMSAEKAARQREHIKAGYAKKAGQKSNQDKAIRSMGGEAKRIPGGSENRAAASSAKSLAINKTTPNGDHFSIKPGKDGIKVEAYSEGKADGFHVHFSPAGKGKYKITNFNDSTGNVASDGLLNKLGTKMTSAHGSVVSASKLHSALKSYKKEAVKLLNDPDWDSYF